MTICLGLQLLTIVVIDYFGYEIYVCEKSEISIKSPSLLLSYEKLKTYLLF